MTTENETNAETSTTTGTATTTSEVKEVTLDDVYRDAGIDKLATETKTETKTEPVKEAPKIEPSSIPDPYDSENFKAWLARNAAGTQELHKAVVDIARHLSVEQQARVVQSTKADIESAVKSIEETVQLGKPKVVEAYLDGEVRADQRLKTLWENRAKNPSAWSSAVQVIAKKMAKEFDFKVDPNLSAAQRARKEAQKTMATTSVEDNSSPLEERLGKAQGADFNREWESLVSGGA